MPVIERGFLRQVRHVRPDPGDPRASAVCDQIRRDFGVLAPPFALHLPAPDVMAAHWSVFREPAYAGRVDRAVKEAVAAAVSEINSCPYCVDVHSTMLTALDQPVSDSIVEWARASRQPDAEIVKRPPFPRDQAPELIGIAIGYHYINRMVHIFAVDSPFPLAGGRFGTLVRRAAVPLFRRLLALRPKPGESSQLLEPARLPADLAWAQDDPAIADAFARAAAAFDVAGRRALGDDIRHLVSARVRDWRGEAPGVSRSWVETAVADLPRAQRPPARFVLLAALASYQVDGAIVEDARPAPGPDGDRALVEAAAWASFTAARRVGSWLHSASNSEIAGTELTAQDN